MPAATLLRIEIERSLANRFPAALSPAPRVIETAPTGIAEVDNLLDGGLPTGAITELAGTESSGRTSLALAFLARLTGDGRACAWVDSDDTLDPESAAANGVVLRQLLWVRCRGNAAQGKGKPWPRLEQAIRAADLLLQSGGFAAIVLDLAGTAHEHAKRIPLATWFRFRQAAARTRCSLVVLDQAACAQSSAAAVLECTPLAARDRGNTVIDGFTFTIRRSPLRPGAATPTAGMRKPPASAWPADCPWNVEKRA
ncbi:MAG TPA: ATPase domain-containing protein [Terracidiphilus sp.]|nr:ATPase domain-containing protein [Terracidiphilus sp.]